VAVDDEKKEGKLFLFQSRTKETKEREKAEEIDDRRDQEWLGFPRSQGKKGRDHKFTVGDS